MLWSRRSKTKFCGARHVRISVCETIGLFNTGAESLAKIMGMCGVTLGANTMKELRQQDKKGIVSAASTVKSVLSIQIKEENDVLNERQKQTRMLIKQEHSV